MLKVKNLFFFLLIFISNVACSDGAPIVTSVTPTHLPATSLGPITITGSGFTGVTAVSFDDQLSLVVIINSDSSITAIPPDNVPGNVHITITTPSGSSTPTPADYFTYTGTTWEAYITLLSEASIAHATLTEPASSNPTIPATFGPVGVAITPNGRTAYVATAGTNGVSIIDLVTNTLKGSVMNVGSVPQFVAISPTKPRAYLTTAGSQNLGVIDTTTHTLITTVFIPPTPTGLAITPDGLRLFVSNYDNSTIRYFDISGDIPVELGLISAPTTLQSLAITPDGTLLVGVGDNGAITVDLTQEPYLSSALMATGITNEGITILPNGTAGYITDRLTNTVTPLNLQTVPPTLSSPINILGRPVGIASSPDNQKVYTANQSDSTSSSINLNNLTFEDLIIGNGPIDLAITPDQAPVARFIATIAEVGTPSFFDASGSVSPIGSITLYSWDFGDGTTIQTVSPTIEHAFIIGGSLTVTLTVTNSAGTSTSQRFTGRTVSNNGGPSAQYSQVFQVPGGLLPPSKVQGGQIANRFLTQTDYVNVLIWQPPLSGTPVAYAIYRDAALKNLVVTQKASAPLRYEDHNRMKGETYTYYLVAINATGEVSAPAIIVVRPRN